MPDGNRSDARVHLSKSILTTWETCRLRYRYERVDRVLVDQPPSLAQQRGTVAHAAVAEVLKAMVTAESDAGRGIIRGVCDASSVSEPEANRIETWVADATRIAYGRGGRFRWIEELVGVDRSRDFFLWGKFDLVVVGGSVAPVEVIDWTFGRARIGSPDELRSSLGGQIYRLALGHALPDRALRPIAVTEANIPNGTEITTIPSDADVTVAWAAMKRYAEDVRQARETADFPPTPGTHCNWCSYRAVCPVVVASTDAAPV